MKFITFLFLVSLALINNNNAKSYCNESSVVFNELSVSRDSSVSNRTTYKPSETDISPECINLELVRARIMYPAIARESGIEGRVIVNLLIDTTGRVVSIETIKGPDVFYDEIQKNVVDLKFTPGYIKGKSVRCLVTVPFKFELVR
ncbi:MAG: energy transducer TonB [Ignavibacteriae bacterium]|nr:MAG: energy transducer TonB [Ignavibacteriota bacterium]